MRRSTIRSLAIGGAALIMTSAVGAAAIDVIAARQQNFKSIGKANKAISDELKNGQPSLVVIQSNAKTLKALSGQLPQWFPAGSGPEAGAKTKALPAIWTQKADFAKAAANFAAAAQALDTAAASGDSARVMAASASLGSACKGCHDTFRSKEKD